jgi:DNA-binding winged helix-turn-helix (wHTH) protein
MMVLNQNIFAMIVDGEIIKLSYSEYEVLSVLIERRLSVVSNDELIDRAGIERGSIKAMVYRIRKKFGPESIHHSHGRGYWTELKFEGD